MLAKKVKKRASLLAIFLLASVLGVFLILNTLNKNILYFNSPTDIKINQDINFDKKIRVGGMVKKNTLNRLIKSASTGKLSLLTFIKEDPTGYGRIIRSSKLSLIHI